MTRLTPAIADVQRLTNRKALALPRSARATSPGVAQVGANGVKCHVTWRPSNSSGAASHSKNSRICSDCEQMLAIASLIFVVVSGTVVA